MIPRRIRFAVAPGAGEELRKNGRADLARLPEMHAGERDFIVGMRATAPGPVVEGSRYDYRCAACRELVRLAPSGQRVVALGASVVCIDCVPIPSGGAS